jgi:hypothetical protein
MFIISCVEIGGITYVWPWSCCIHEWTAVLYLFVIGGGLTSFGGGIWFIYDTLSTFLPACVSPATQTIATQCSLSQNLRLAVGAMHVVKS